MSQVGELGPHRQQGGRPQGAVDVGVDARHHLLRRRRSSRKRLAHLLEPRLAMAQVVLGHHPRTRQLRTVARQDGELAELPQPAQRVEVVAQPAVRMRHDRGAPAKDRVPGQDRGVTDLTAQHAALQAEEEKLTLASQRLQAKVDAFRTRKETIKATYTAAEAQTKIGEAFSGISEEMGDVGLAVQRAEDKTQALQARAGAIDELLASGALDDMSGTAKDDITAELERMGSQGEVELELARLKGELGAGSAPEAIESGPQAAPATAAPPGAAGTTNLAAPAVTPRAEEERQ